MTILSAEPTSRVEVPGNASVREISVEEVARKRADKEPIVLLDVREPWELERARLGYADVDVAPLSELAARGAAALPPPARRMDAEIIVFCHLGGRSAQVAAWLLDQGYTNVSSMAGGIAAYAARIDPSIGAY